tara:strand:+ start:1770 stop:2375 length:606 start_codon:yes stop_codon:yes gene_type:complete
MYIPSSVLNGGDFSKASSISSDKVVFSDKIVSGKRSPLLYIIELGRRQTLSVMNNANPDIKAESSSVSKDRGYLARDLLVMCNVSYVKGEKKHSLLRRKGDVPDVANKNMTDVQQFEETFNQKTTAEDKFKNTNDPFYKADENQMANATYTQEVDGEGKITKIPDLSRLASSMAFYNLDKSTRSNKYFMIQDSIYGSEGGE